MLSIGTIGHNARAYYAHLAREDYYLSGGEPPGRWIGQGAAAFGLGDTVKTREFERVFAGFSPDGSKALTQNAGSPNRQPGWDLTFSANKQLSCIWSQAPPWERDQIARCHYEAMRTAIGYLEETSAFSRTGKGGAERVGGRLFVAVFEHGTSRALDPNLHSHALVLNACVREQDGSTGSLMSQPLYDAKMVAGRVYRAALRLELEQQLGLAIQAREDGFFDVPGVPEPLLMEFSKRRVAIVAALEAKGYYSAQAAAVAALETREQKRDVPREQLFAEWQAVGREHGFGPPEAMALIRPSAAPTYPETYRRDAILTAVQEAATFRGEHLTERQQRSHYGAASVQKRYGALRLDAPEHDLAV